MIIKVRFISVTSLLFLIGLAACVKKKVVADNKQPNFLVIMVDDMGYSDPGCYGGEIQTPNLDNLANNGLRFTDFHNCARSSPSRASLLTGVYPHEAGMPNIGRSLTPNVVTLAEVLKQGGYQTGMTGKWHLSRTQSYVKESKGLKSTSEEMMKWVSHQTDHGDFAPLESYPSNRGFDEHYGVIWGVVNHFDPFSLVHNEEPIKEVSEDFYFTDFINDKSVELIEQFGENDRPFFLYVAHSAPHWPLHAPKEDIMKYKGLYDDGWDSLRVRRYRRMVEMGLFDSKTAPLAAASLSGEKTSLDPTVGHLSWEEYEHKEWETNHMEVHAAMVDRVDQGIGMIIQKLKETGQFDNTLIIFLSDNGASPERRGKKPGGHRSKYMRNGNELYWITEEMDTIPPGSEETYGFLGKNWTGAVNSPFRYWKGESYEGGTSTPFIVHWPAGLKTEPGSITSQFGHVMDVMPTFLELAGIDYPQKYNENTIIPHSGISLVPVFEGRTREEHEAIFWEHIGGKAVRKGDWKISALRDGDWELFNIREDRTETNDLSEIFPEKIEELEQEWERWYDKMKSYAIQ